MASRTLKEFSTILGGLSAFSMLFIVVLFTASIPFHDLKKKDAERRYKQLQHPTSSSVIFFGSSVENVGMSNHCDYLVGEIRTAPLTKQDIVNFYKQKTFDGFDNNIKPITVWFQNDLEAYGEPFRPEFNWFLTHKREFESDGITYIVSEVDQMYDAGLDYRCK